MFFSYFGIDFMVNFEGKFGDGMMGIFYVRLGIGRMVFLDLFGKMKDGFYVFSYYVKYIKVFVFCLEFDIS